MFLIKYLKKFKTMNRSKKFKKKNQILLLTYKGKNNNPQLKKMVIMMK